MMRKTIYIFVSVAGRGMRAFTADEAGANLPVEYGPWKRAGVRSSSTSGLSDPLAESVERDGFFLVGSAQRGAAQS
jgi:hypothetical protein